MNTKRKIGIAFIALSIVLLIAVVLMVHANISHIGPWAGKITTYKPPFENHGLFVVLLGIISSVSFLSGVILSITGIKE